MTNDNVKIKADKEKLVAEKDKLGEIVLKYD